MYNLSKVLFVFVCLCLFVSWTTSSSTKIKNTNCIERSSGILSKASANYFDILTGDSIKYWDAYYTFNDKIAGTGWCFTRDSVFVEYEYRNSVRSELDYYDIERVTFRFLIVKDTLVIRNYIDYKLLILKLTDDSIIVKDIGSMRYTYLDSFLHVKSTDQVTVPHLLE